VLLSTGIVDIMFVFSIDRRGNNQKPISCKNQNPDPKNQSKIQLNQRSGLIESKELKPNVPNPVKDLKICTY